VVSKNYFLYASCHTLRLEQPSSAPPEANAANQITASLKSVPRGKSVALLEEGDRGTAERMPKGVKNLIFIYR
jgi:lysophospholipid acyltransferase (LPLAT)-like uncharacterized protein